jgi:hypothetical protein
MMTAEQPPTIETDPRFPSGPWTGFFLQRGYPGKQMMDLRLTFLNGNLNGEGRDWVGEFAVKGRYDVLDGKCYWTKKYVGKHDVFYAGYNEGKGIWGGWEINILGIHLHGGFYIWPEGMDDPTIQRLSEEADPPVPEEELVETGITEKVVQTGITD